MERRDYFVATGGILYCKVLVVTMTVPLNNKHIMYSM